ncbi:hypothetical protein GW933_00140 [Candidatus Falkowbacteria bacterium]|uniref:Uncharacterized protein n=1 Tax=Candidatus Buchananbacteria bacterium CG10_big_fil_rev_8_21_14_0_10_33_19 TaxID=1974525 RepID=A0A2H0W2Z9_9BACT|nr:hypothetical protein [Candidatus Falkowbacteria bacterium]PIS05667.1 MAG: hypothetical protein COT80_02760 [Candidatus Buchananbacteria bacterium CG10_big_fil_rev_8_21_14_0_10_33_19]
MISGLLFEISLVLKIIASKIIWKTLKQTANQKNNTEYPLSIIAAENAIFARSDKANKTSEIGKNIDRKLFNSRILFKINF